MFDIDKDNVLTINASDPLSYYKINYNEEIPILYDIDNFYDTGDKYSFYSIFDAYLMLEIISYLNIKKSTSDIDDDIIKDIKNIFKTVCQNDNFYYFFNKKILDAKTLLKKQYIKKLDIKTNVSSIINDVIKHMLNLTPLTCTFENLYCININNKIKYLNQIQVRNDIAAMYYVLTKYFSIEQHKQLLMETTNKFLFLNQKVNDKYKIKFISDVGKNNEFSNIYGLLLMIIREQLIDSNKNNYAYFLYILDRDKYINKSIANDDGDEPNIIHSSNVISEYTKDSLIKFPNNSYHPRITILRSLWKIIIEKILSITKNDEELEDSDNEDSDEDEDGESDKEDDEDEYTDVEDDD